MTEPAQQQPQPQTNTNGEAQGLAAKRDRYSALTASEAGFRPTTLFQAMELANLLTNSNFVPEAYRGKPGDVLAALMYGAEIGLGPMQSLRGIAVVNGMPSVWGDVLLGLIKSAPDCLGIVEMTSTEIKKAGAATCTVKRRGHETVTRTFSLSDAERAGLLSKGTYKAYPERMLMMRARAWAIRDQYADKLAGLYTYEEAVDLAIDAHGEHVMAEQQATAAAQAPAAAPPKALSPTTGAAALKDVLSREKAKEAVGVEPKPQPQPQQKVEPKPQQQQPKPAAKTKPKHADPAKEPELFTTPDPALPANVREMLEYITNIVQAEEDLSSDWSMLDELPPAHAELVRAAIAQRRRDFEGADNG